MEKRYEKLECGLLQDKIQIPIHVFNEETKQLVSSECSVIEGEKEELFDEISKIQETFPNFPTFEVFLTYFLKAGICPQGLWDEYLDWLIEMESHSRTYKALPYGGGLFLQPDHIMDAFAIIRSAENFYINQEQEKSIQKANAEQKNKGKSKR